MNDPTFRLEGIVKSKNELEDFEGPLALILQLLSKNKIEIQDIQISLLLEQYLEYLDEMKAMDLEIASEFVVMASHLVYIKARVLLNAGEEPSELEELMQSLEKLRNSETYEKIRAVTPFFESMYKNGGGTFTKPQEYIPSLSEYGYSHAPSELVDAILRALKREDAVAIMLEQHSVPIPARIVYSVSAKTEQILSYLIRTGTTPITALFRSCGSKTELVATFIALLELCIDGRLYFSGEGENMTVCKISGGGDEPAYGDA